MFETLKADYDRYYKLLPASYTAWDRMIFNMTCLGIWALTDYRFRRWLTKQPVAVRFLLRYPALLYHLFIQCTTGISIETGTTIGKGFYIGHFSSIFIHHDVVIGENCSISQGVSIGYGGRGEKLGTPTLGNSVYVAPGAKIFGKITIGDKVAIGANAVVFRNVPSGATAVGVPARVLTKEMKEKLSL